MTVFNIKRNDIAACIDYYRSKGGNLSEDEMEVMLMLQDDQDELIKALHLLNEEMKIKIEA